MKEGSIVIINIPQSDNNLKLRPVLLLKQLPKFNDFLVCGISTQLNQYVRDFDEIMLDTDLGFSNTGLKQSSLIRLGFLAVIPIQKIPGNIGFINSFTHKNLLLRLAHYLTTD